MAPLNPTTPFCAELLTAIYIDLLASVYDTAISLILVRTRSSYSANINRLMVSSVSISISFSHSAT
jgi:hypothetical protein